MSDALATDGSLDREGNGLVENSRRYELATDSGTPLLLKNWKGRTYSDASTPHWNAIQAVQHEDGFQVLCAGEGKKDGQFEWLSVNADGRINGKSGWQAANEPATQGWELIFGDVIQNDGVIGKASDIDGNGFLDHHPHYQIYTGGQSAALTTADGKTLSRKTSKNWKPLKAISTSDGFQVLIGSRGRKQQRFQVLDVDLDGQINQKTAWTKGAKALFSGWNTQFRNLLLDQNSKGGVKAASTGEGSSDGQLIYTATADDTSQLTYALKDEGQGFDGVLNIDENSGEVRLLAEKLQEIVKDISFTVTTTDRAGNSSEWPVTVTLNSREKTEDSEQEDNDASAAGGISAFSVEPTDLGDQTPEAKEESDVSNAAEEEILVSKEEVLVSKEEDGDTESKNNENTNNDTENAETPEAGSDNPKKINEEESNNKSDVDTTPKEDSSGLQKPSTPILLADSDSGNSQTDGLTNINTPTLIGTAAANATVELESEQGVLGTTTADGDGNWSFTLKSAEALNDGNHSITARVSSEDGSASESSEALTLNVDTRAPELTSNSSAEAEILVAKGTLDQNNDGLVDGTNQSQILHNGSGIEIKNPNAVTRGNSNNPKTGIQLLKAISSENGYEVLVKGTGTKFSDKWSRYKFKQWEVDQTGTITDFGVWRGEDYALSYGWEEKFGDIIKPDGVITPPPRNTFFVSLDGNDNNPGTLEEPFKTIKMGLQRIGQTRDVPGGTLTIRGGTYRLPIGRYNSGKYNQEASTISLIGLHGDKDNPIKIQNYEDEEVVITGAKQINNQWEIHDGNIWKIEVNYLPSQLFLDGKMLTGARWPNITKDWDQLDDSNSNNPTPGSYWSPDSFANQSSEMPAVDLKGAVVVPHEPLGGNKIKVIKEKRAGSSELILENKEYGINWAGALDEYITRDRNWDAMPEEFYLTNHINLLDQPGEWHLEQRHGTKKVKTPYGMDYVLTRKPSILYAWMPDGSDPNTRNLEARAFSNIPALASENSLLSIKQSSNLVFDGITFHTGEINLNGTRDITFNDSKFLYSGHHAHMIADTKTGEHNVYGHGGYVNLQTNNMGWGGDEGSRIGLGEKISWEEGRSITISNSEFAYTYGGNFLTWGKGISGNTLDNVYFHNKVAGGSAFEVGRNSHSNNVNRLEYHTFGWGGVGRLGQGQYKQDGADEYSKSNFQFIRVYNPFYHGDDAGVQVNQAQVFGSTYNNNWFHDLPGRNGLRFDGAPAGFGGTAYNNVSFNNRRGFRLKGDYHKVFNNIAFQNTNNDVRVTGDKFYGWREGAKGAPSDQMEVDGKWYSVLYPGDPGALSYGGHINSDIHNNAGDKNSDIPVANPSDKTGNSMSKDLRAGRLLTEELRDTNNFDFRPRAESSLIDAGTHIPGFTDGYKGSAPDIGAYEYGDDHYWIPGYQTKKAKTPIPNNGAYNAKLDTDLIWLEGRNGTSNDIYFGTNPSDLQFQGNQSNNIFTPKEPLTAGQTYYWRIDTVTDKGTIPGDVWMFAPENPEAPEAPNAPLLDQASDSGRSNSDRSTSTTTPTFSGSGNTGETVELFQNSVSLGTSEIGLDGRWTFTVPAELALQDGLQTITAKFSKSGVSSSMSKPLMVSIDSTAPIFTSSETAAAIDENSGIEQVVHRVKTTDQSPTTYYLPSENTEDSEQFAIDETTGELRLLANPNFEAQETYSVVVETLDLAGNRETQSVTVPITDIAETDLNLDGLLDGSGQSQIFTNGNVITIRNQQGRPKGDYKNAKIGYNLIKAIDDEGQYRILAEGSGSQLKGKFQQWNTDDTGLITSQSDWKTAIQALALGWEDDFGDVINKDGFVGPPPAIDADGDGLVDGTNQSKIFFNERSIQMTNNKGNAVQGNFKNAKFGYEIIKAVKTDTGFDLLLKGNGKQNRGRFRELSTNSEGVITTRSAWISADSALTQGWEDRFGDIIKVDGQVGLPPAEDKNGDGLVDGLKQPLIFDGGSGFAIKDQGGKVKGHSNNKKIGYQVIKAVTSDDGFELLLKGKGTKTRNQFLQWKTNPEGIIQSGSGWQSDKAAIDWEKQFGDIIQPDGVIGLPPVAGDGPSVVEDPAMLDQNNDGLVDGTNQSQIVDDTIGLPITDRRGRVKSNWKNRKWGYTILKAVPKDEGFDVLLKGSGKKNRSRFLIWSTDPSGMITGNTGWKNTPFALKNEWESIFGDIIQPNGVIN